MEILRQEANLTTLNTVPAAFALGNPPRDSIPPTLEELSHSAGMMLATTVIEIQVERFHAEWDTLVPIHRDALCRAGNSIRSAMHRYNITVADLSHVQRAIYDITAPPGRCR